MAYPLSCSTISHTHRESYTDSFLRSLQNKSLFHTHLRRQTTARPIYARLTRIDAKKNDAYMLLNGVFSYAGIDKEANFSFPFVNTLESSMKQFQSLMAVIFIFIEIASPIPLYGWQVWSISPAEAVLYSPETTTLPRTGELALRRAIPANTNMKSIQIVCHAVSLFLLYFLGGFSWGHLVLAQDSTAKTFWNDGG